ncbi:MAG TPA: S8 family serine peptidase [Gemmataceae bacterium]|nr:S8 family serine peptidase [Gemmataceae bacterium]
MSHAIGESAATPDTSSLVATTDSVPQRSELLERLGVSAWHAHGWRGRGLKVAVLDSGFSGYQTHLGKALPRNVKVRSFRFDGNFQAKNSQHGILCAEVIHALAPEAELLLANWEPERPDQFLAAVRWARQEGARIISCSIIMPTWSDCEGHGRVHEELAHLLGTGEPAGDALFVASAGNTAQRHWSGTFRDGGDGYHVWKRAGSAAQTENAIKPWGSERVSVELCCPVSAGYEVIVTDATAARTIGRTRSADVRGIGNAVVAFAPESGHDYRVRVRQIRKARGGFHLVVLGGGLHHVSSSGSIPFPGDGSEVLAVGAVDQAGRRLSYSSCGTKHDGTKPDFVATVPFPSSWRSKPFSGTSAAAPQAAALSALVWSRHPDWSAQRIRDTLQNAARPCSSGSPAWATGHGLIHLPNRSALMP